MIEQVEKLSAKFQLHSFSDGRGLGKRQINIHIGRSPQKIPRQGSVSCQRRIRYNLSVRREDSGSRYARGCWIVGIAALCVTKAVGVEYVVPRSASKIPCMMRIKGVDRADYICENIGGIARTRRTFRAWVEAVRQPSKNVDRQARAPSDDREQTPSLGQALWTRTPRVINGQIPTTTESDAMPDILVARSPEQIGLIGRHCGVPLTEARSIVNAVSEGVGQGKVCSAQKAVVGDLLRQAGLEAVVVGLRDVLKLR